MLLRLDLSAEETAVSVRCSCHGTGDVYASSFVGALMNGCDAFSAAKIAAEFTMSCIENTLGDEKHWYGVKFEPMLPKLIEEVRR